MSTVKINNDLVLRTKNVLYKPFDERYKKHNILSVEDATAIYKKYFVNDACSEILTMMDSHHVTRPMNRMSFDTTNLVVGNVSGPKDGDRKHWFVLPFKDHGVKIRYLYGWSSIPTGYSPGKYGSRDTYEYNSDRDQPVVNFKEAYQAGEISYDYLSPLEAIIKERDELWQSVSKILVSCTTLNQAIKVWPGIAKLVDPADLARVERKPERKTAPEDVGLEEEEVNRLNLNVIRNQMVGV